MLSDSAFDVPLPNQVSQVKFPGASLPLVKA